MCARENHPTREKATRGAVSPFLAWGDFHARSGFARSTIPEKKWGTTRSLYLSHLLNAICVKIFIMNRYISKSYTTSKNTIDRQFTEQGQL